MTAANTPTVTEQLDEVRSRLAALLRRRDVLEQKRREAGAEFAALAVDAEAEGEDDDLVIRMTAAWARREAAAEAIERVGRQVAVEQDQAARLVPHVNEELERQTAAAAKERKRAKRRDWRQLLEEVGESPPRDPLLEGHQPLGGPEPHG